MDADLLHRSLTSVVPDVGTAAVAELALIFGSLDLVTMAAYAVAGARATRLFDAASTRTWIDRGCGALHLLPAAALALLRRPAATV